MDTGLRKGEDAIKLGREIIIFVSFTGELITNAILCKVAVSSENTRLEEVLRHFQVQLYPVQELFATTCLFLTNLLSEVS